MFKILLVEDDRELNKTVCAYLEQNQEIPILFMTARDDFASEQRGFRSGIDDYMVKPVDLEEMLLRIEALLRRAKIAASKKLTVGDVFLDAEEHTAYLKGEEIPLTVREFNLIYKLLSYPKKHSPDLSLWMNSGTALLLPVRERWMYI